MKDWKIGVRISAGFAVILGISLLLGIFAVNRTLEISKKTDAVSSNYLPSVLALDRIDANLHHSVSLLLQVVATSDPKLVTRLNTQIVALLADNEKLYLLYESLPSTPEEVAAYDASKSVRARFLALYEEVRKAGQSTDAKEIVAAQQLFEQQLSPALGKYSDDVQSLVDRNKAAANQGLATIQQAVASGIHGVIVGLALSVGIAVPIVFFIVRGITRPLNQTVAALELLADGDLTAIVEVQTKDELGRMGNALNVALERLRSSLKEVAASAANSNSSSREMAAAAQQIASGAQEQAASLEETSASLEQITAAVRQSADNAAQASQLATGSRESAEQGQEVVASAIAAMAEINVASAKISDIISTINEIAFQTNLLAVNAAVEAARAGEEGRGFAVVATEVRSLAQRSAEAAKEIKNLIQDSLQKVEKGTELVNRSGATLQSIVGSVKRVTDIVGEMAAASAEQSTGVEQVNTAITQMDQVTQSNSAQTEELSSTAQAFAEQATRLTQLVGQFKLGDDEQSRRDNGRKPLPKGQAVGTLRRPAKAALGKQAPPVPIRKPFTESPVMVGTPEARSDDASFEEF